LPNPRDLEAGEMVTRANNLVSEEPTHGPNPFDNKFENVSIIEKTLGGNSPAETSKNIPNETAEMDTGEMDDTGLLQPEDVVDGGENVEKALYLYEDKDGNMIVVDADGNPVESPPGLVYNEKTGKYYASYNQDPTKGDTTGKDVSSLGKELPEYKKAVEEMYLYETEDGKQIVVDADGNPIKSPPGLTYDETTGKYYASYGGLDPAKMDPTGIDKSQLGLELPQYKKPLDGLSLYEDQDGNIVVVDVDGNPIKSPPGLTYDETTGKYYASYGGGDPAKLDPTGKDKSQLGLELPKFKKSLDGLSLYEDQDGNMVVVGANGSPVASPPGLVYDEATGKYYASYGGEDPAKMDQSGKDKTKLGLELPKYKKPLDGLKLYTDSEGNPVVVDADGNPVSSPPGLTYDEVTGKYFASYGGDDPAKLDKAGNEKSNFGVELSDYEKPINDMYIFEDDNGKMIVVDENGIPVQSPPGLAYNEQSGKYYASYSTDPIKADGAGKMTSKSIVEMKHYKPKWWKE